MDVQYIKNKITGKSEYAVIPIEDYERLREASEMPLKISDNPIAAIVARDGTVPKEVSSEINDGKNQIKAWRCYKNLTQDELARKAGISKAYLSQIESNKRGGRTDKLVNIAKVLNCKVDDILVFDKRDPDQLKEIYDNAKLEIEKLWHNRKQFKTEDKMFADLVSCILSSRAKWSSVKNIMAKLGNGQMLSDGSVDQLSNQLNGLSGRYLNKNQLAQYIVDARQLFPFIYMVIHSIQTGNIELKPGGISSSDIYHHGTGKQLFHSLEHNGISPDGLRELILQFRGIGDKQASHFLATAGFECYAILDVHVLKFLVRYGVLSEKPQNLTRSEYRHIEEKMRAFSETIGIPFHHLDTLFWQLGSGEKKYQQYPESVVCPTENTELKAEKEEFEGGVMKRREYVQKAAEKLKEEGREPFSAKQIVDKIEEMFNNINRGSYIISDWAVNTISGAKDGEEKPYPYLYRCSDGLYVVYNPKLHGRWKRYGNKMEKVL